MADWLLPALTILPLLLLTFLAVGLPWAMILLPRPDWRDRPLMITVSLALGPVLLTTVMFLLGTFLRITVGTVIIGGGLVVLWGGALAWQKMQRSMPVPNEPSAAPLQWWERLLVIALAAAVVVRVIHVAYWPFTAYDSLWVYGYNARLFFLHGQIPAAMDYYPQLLPLSFTYAQLLWGGINDHAARMVIPVFAAASILAAYVLGRRLFNRRVGLMTAALWTFYPQHALWAQFGDLEVPLTFYYTLAAAFLLMAWRAERYRWHYAAAAGLAFGGAMWLKPTAGAFVWGVLLLFVVEIVRVRFDWPRIWDRFRLLFVVGAFSVPIGGMWYLRNVLLGHDAVIFPPSFWLDRAQRSGQELLWPLLIAALLALYLVLEPKSRRPTWRLPLAGLALLLAGTLPSSGLFWFGAPTSPLSLLEVLLLAAGVFLLGFAAWQWRNRGGTSPFDDLGWQAATLVLPYFVTWFYSYSYHPRLAFAIAPLQLLLAAVLILEVVPRLAGYIRPARRVGIAAAALLVLIIPGLWLTVAATVPHLLAGDLPNDDSKHRVSNYATYGVVEALREAEAQGPIHVIAPGALRLPFFFPLAAIETEPLPDIDFLDGRATHYIAGLEADVVYREAGLLHSSSARAVPGLARLAEVVRGTADADFWYEVYETHTELRFVSPFIHVLPEQETIYPDFAELKAYAISANEHWPGREMFLTVHWQVFGRTDQDYTMFVHLTDGETVYQAWDHIPGGGWYHTYFWEPGEFVTDEFAIPLDASIPPGTYQIRVGLYDFETQDRLPVTLNGEPGFDGVVLLPEFTVLPGPPG